MIARKFYSEAEREEWEERAAIIEYYALKSRIVAEYLAYEMLKHKRRLEMV